jgi:L-alanine-DL-glutamate epimerase-like enolase superfamily enzyme
MRVTSYVIDCVRVPTAEAITGSHLVLRLRTDDGLEGFGYVSRLRDDALKTCASLVQRYVDEAIVGEDPRDTERLFSKLWRRGGGLPGYVERAASVIDVALWDLKAKAAGQPLWQALGGFRSRVDCYASWRLEPAENLGGPAARGGSLLAESASYLLERGFKAMKFHTLTMSQAGVVEHMRVLRETCGPDVPIMVDVNQRWDVKQAIAAGRALAPYDPYWIEDPVPVDDYAGMRQIRETLETRICAGEPYRSLSPFRYLLENRSVDIAMIDLDLGLTGFMKVAHMAEAFGMPVVPHLATEVLAHAVAAVPNGLTVEYYPWAEPLWCDPLHLDADGRLVLPEKPGLGLELDEAALARLAV